MNDFSALKKFAESLRDLPKELPGKVAIKAAPALTAVAQQTFSAGQTPYGETWKPGKDGKPVTLYKTGKLFSKIRYVAAGTKLKVNLGVKYAKYQIGKRPMFPKGGVFPADYVQVLEDAALEVIQAEMSL